MEILRQIQQVFAPRRIELSDFQRRKLLHEFHTFYDVNKDGRLQWHDFELARDYICKKSGWADKSAQWNHCRQLFVELWTNLRATADSDDDGQITVDEWLALWTSVLRAKHEHDERLKKTKTKTTTTRTSSSSSSSSAVKSSGTTAAAADDQQATQQQQADTDTTATHSDAAAAAAGDESLGGVMAEYLPPWFERYVEYKFNLLDRAGDGVIDEDEFEFTLNDGFDVSPRDCRIAHRMLTHDGERRLDRSYFRQLAMQFYLSDDASDVGNFINGQLQYD